MKRADKPKPSYNLLFQLALLTIIILAAGFYIWFMTGLRFLLPYLCLGVAGFFTIIYLFVLRYIDDRKHGTKRHLTTHDKGDTDA